ncbi:MAG: hypothetical protein Q7U03_09200 [Syntrophales bacterium]|nr:hypothetical protein [Syntrophales bacterium]
MNLMFWKSEGQTKRLPGPKEPPQQVVSYLVTNAKMSPDLVWRLKAVTIPRSDEKDVIDIRVYDSNVTERNGVKVINYHSLNDHSALVIFDGWYNKVTHAVDKKKL